MARESQLNVIVFFTDQQRWDTLGLHGNPLDLTPNLDRVARENTHVRFCFTPQPLCGPARACMQTGQYATQAGVHRNGLTLPPEAPTLAQQFAAAGYDTGYIGKWHLGPPKMRGAVPEAFRAGYDYWLASNHLEHTSDAYHTTVFDRDGQAHDLPGYRVDALTDATIRYVTQPRERPFFCFLSLLEPHHQNHIDDYPPPIGYRERYSGRWTPPDLLALGGSAAQHLGGYFGMVKRIDEAFGRLMDALISRRLHKKTIILFTSDHGNHFKTRNIEYKRSAHEASIRVPCVLAGPGFRGGGQLESLTSLIDMPPTLLDAAGVSVPETMHGQRLN
ncbi:MAG: sulfatase-like hydrolase/transferase, partial [Verrucomicrobiota bacterium]